MREINLAQLSDAVMLERGLDPGYSALAKQQAERAQLPEVPEGLADLRAWAWCSIDNGECEEVSSKDLDQISLALPAEGGNSRVYVAIADVDVLVPKNCAIDLQAQRNTTTIYTAQKTYPMIHPRLSEGLTSLNQGEDRLAVVNEMLVSQAGEVLEFRFYRAVVRNLVKLNYASVGAWLAGSDGPPSTLSVYPAVMDSLKRQNLLAQAFKQQRREKGSLQLESLEARAELQDGRVVGLVSQMRNLATELIENLMVTSNGCASQFLRSLGLPTLQRIVRRPKYWDAIVELAAQKNCQLPQAADSRALAEFLDHERRRDPLHFPDLSLSILKLLGRGEYVVEAADQPLIGHFGLAVREYSHSTAPNRRYPDILSQRLLKAAMAGQSSPYDLEELEKLARHCSQQEGQAQKVERQSHKSAAALLLERRKGEVFEAVVSGQSRIGSWVRLLEMPVEGKLLGTARLGQRLRVQLAAVNVEKGFIDFRPSHSPHP